MKNKKGGISSGNKTNKQTINIHTVIGWVMSKYFKVYMTQIFEASFNFLNMFNITIHNSNS